MAFRLFPALLAAVVFYLHVEGEMQICQWAIILSSSVMLALDLTVPRLLLPQCCFFPQAFHCCKSTALQTRPFYRLSNDSQAELWGKNLSLEVHLLFSFHTPSFHHLWLYDALRSFFSPFLLNIHVSQPSSSERQLVAWRGARLTQTVACNRKCI